MIAENDRSETYDRRKGVKVEIIVPVPVMRFETEEHEGVHVLPGTWITYKKINKSMKIK